MDQQPVPHARRVPVSDSEPLIGADRYDYADAFETALLDTDARTAEEFARSALEQSPPPLRWLVWNVHRHVLRVDQGPRSSPGHILGWRIVTSEPDVVQLAAVSPLLGRAVIVGRRTGPTRTRVTTYIFHTRPALARAIWAITGPLHRRVAPYLMERAAAASREGVPA